MFLQIVFFFAIESIDPQIVQVRIQMTILRVDSVKLDANPSKPFLALYFNHRIKIINSHRNPIVPQRNDLHFNCIHFDVTLLHTHTRISSEQQT